MSCRTCCRDFSLVLALLALAVLVLGLPQAAFAQNNLDYPLGAFQMDGNAVKDPGSSGTPLLCFGTDLSGAPAESYNTGNSVSGCPNLGSFSPVTFGDTTDDWTQVYTKNGHYITGARAFTNDTFGGNSDPSTFLGTSTKDTFAVSQMAWQAPLLPL